MKEKNTFSIGDSISFGWKSFKKHWTFLLPAVLVVILVSVGLSWIIGNLDGFAAFILQIASWIINIILNIGLLTIAWNIVKEKDVDWGNFTENIHLWWKMLLGSLLYTVIVYAGTILLIVPGIYFGIKYQFFGFALIENPQRGIWESFKRSAEITKGAKWKLFGFWWVMLGIIILGFIALGVGVLVSILVISIANAFIFTTLAKQITGETSQKEEENDNVNTETEITDVETEEVEA